MLFPTSSSSTAYLRRFALTSGLILVGALPARAGSFTVAAGATDTTAKTLGSGSGQTGSIAATGTLSVSGGTVAVTISGSNATLTNDGTITQTGSGRAIRDNAGVTGLVVTNGSATNSAALIQTADGDVMQMNKSPASVTFYNYGTLTSLNASAGGSQAIDWAAIQSGSNILYNYATGVIQASEADAVRPGVGGFVYNDGLIKSTTASGSSSDGVDAQNNSGITIVNAFSAASGTIEGGRHGITGGALDALTAYTMSITNNVGGTIQGDNGSGINIDGFNSLETVTIVNHGTITGNGHDIGDGKSHDGDGVDVDGLVDLTNTGTIKSINAFSLLADGLGYSEGITVGGGTVINSGLIEGDVSVGNTNAVGRGITFVGNDTATPGVREAIYGDVNLTNQSGGVIRGQTDSAIVVGGPASGHTVSITNEAGGLIEGSGDTAAVIQTGEDNDTVTNAGTITHTGGSSKWAVALGAGDDHLVLHGGTITGGLDGGSGGETAGDVMTVAPGSAGDTLALGGTITNFEKIDVTLGALELTGALHLAIDGATAGVTGGYGQLVFDAANTGTLMLNGATLDLSLGFTPTAGEQFTLVDFANGTVFASGTFAGLGEGGTVTVGGTSFSISYVGGTGNDIVLTTLAAVPEPGAYTLMAGLAAGFLAFWRRRRT